MPLNTTDSELSAAAAADLAEKLKLERQQIIELRRLFRDISLDMRAFVAETGSPPNASVYEDDLRGILAKQGRRVSTAFSGHIVGFLDEQPDDDPIIEDLALIAAIGGLTAGALIDRMRNDVRRRNQAFISEQVTADTRIITVTNQREMDASVLSARAAILDGGDVPTNTEVARISSRDFQNRGFARSPTIAATFTQKIAEGVKDIERTTFFNARNGFPSVIANVPQIQEVEIWVTVGDENVRPTHVAVDFSPKDDFGWSVGGEFLKFPGDPNGSPGNIINCRCSIQPVIE
ncbi:MAG: hypothetical protein V3V40_06225 [Nitrosomonadaceae bacterium]